MRDIDLDIFDLLTSNGPFGYCHLVKFQRPYYSENVSNLVDQSTDADKYSYITDCGFDVNFDDGSLNSSGGANGSQVYRAHKLLGISSINEESEAKINTVTLTLDGLALGASFSGITITTSIGSPHTITLPQICDWALQGFKEGDKITIKNTGSGISNDYIIRSFLSDYRVSASPLEGVGFSSNTFVGNVSLSSEELVGILQNKTNPNYVSYRNKIVNIYRAYFDAETKDIVGSPVLIFKGLILNGGSISQSDDGQVRVNWPVSSHWGDFQKVNGRITSDQSHRALSSSGIPQPASAKKTEYAYDKGFNHAETTVTTLATYKVDVEKQNIKVKKGFLGFGTKIKVSTYTVQEDRNVGLDFNLSSQYIPLIYGVRATPGIPVFADTLNTNADTVYTANVLSEGPIGGIYDIYVNGSSLICTNAVDYDSRNTSVTGLSNTTVLCRGRADRGDVLGSASVTTATVQTFYDNYTAYIQARGVNPLAYLNYNEYASISTEPSANLTGAGVFDGQGTLISSPISLSVDLYSGRPGQKAASNLVTIAKANGFKVQNDYWTNRDSEEYWGPNHRLVDTAYVVSKNIITSSDTTMPELNYVVRGKFIECYNYDYSYQHNSAYSSEVPTNFLIGDTVVLKKTSDDSVIEPSITIVDKWAFANADGSINHRFRFNKKPNLGYDDDDFYATTTDFYMEKGADKWHMLTFNHAVHSQTLAAPIVAGTISQIQSNAGKLRIYFSSAPSADAIVSTPEGLRAFFKVCNSDLTISSDYTEIKNMLLTGVFGSNYLDTPLIYNDYVKFATYLIGKKLVSSSTVKLSGSIPSDYKQLKIRLSRTNTQGDTSYFYSPIDYVGSNILFASSILPIEFIPDAGDILSVVSSGDQRVSINPALQLMDYILSTQYGANAELNDLERYSWLQTARECDGRSKVTVKVTSLSTTAVGDVYKYESSGLKFQGKVSEIKIVNSTSYVEFTDVIGKLSNKWRNWKSYKTGDLVYNTWGHVYRAVSPGIVPGEPVHTSGTVGILEFVSAATLTKVSGAGPSTLSMVVNAGNPVSNFANGSDLSGYSLYDSDDVDYWRYCGWDDDRQANVTKFQTNISLDTSQSVFDNINSFLSHFDGILRQENGKYVLDTKVFVANPVSIFDISEANIVGDISISDDTSRSSYNAVSVNYLDPGNKFESKTISFYNSDFLAQDSNIEKKGSLTVSGVTNYLNVRTLAEQKLLRSRFGLTVSFTLEPFGIFYTPGTVFALTIPKYGWNKKLFMVDGLVLQPDTLVSVTATEIDESLFFEVSVAGINKAASNFINLPGLGELAGKSEITWNLDIIGRPTNLATLVGTEGIITIDNISMGIVDQGLLATQNAVTFGDGTITESPGGPTAVLGDFKTALGTANNTANVGTKTALEIISGIDTSLLELARTNLSLNLFKEVQEALTYDGVGNTIQYVAFKAEERANNALTTVNLIGTVNSDSSAIILDIDKVQLIPGKSLVQTVNSLELKSTEYEGRITNTETVTEQSVTRLEALEQITEDQQGLILSLDSISDGLVESLNLLSLTVGSHTTSISNLNTVSNNNATSISNLRTEYEDTVTEVTTLASAIAGLGARYQIELNVDGYISGLYMVNDGASSDFKILASSFQIKGPDGNAFTPLTVDTVNNRVIMTDVYVNKLFANSVETLNLQVNSVTEFAYSETGDVFNIGTAKTIGTLVTNPNGGRVRLSLRAFITQLNSSTKCTCRLKFYRNGVQIDRTRFFPIFADSNVNTYTDFIIDNSGGFTPVTYHVTAQTVVGTNVGETGGTSFNDVDVYNPTLLVAEIVKR